MIHYNIMNFESITLGEGRQSQKATICMLQCMWYVQTRQIPGGKESGWEVASDWGERGIGSDGWWGTGWGAHLWGGENALELDSGHNSTTCSNTKNHWNFKKGRFYGSKFDLH